MNTRRKKDTPTHPLVLTYVFTVYKFSSGVYRRVGDESNEILTSSMNKSLVVVEPAPREDGPPFLPPVSLVLSYFVIKPLQFDTLLQ